MDTYIIRLSQKFGEKVYSIPAKDSSDALQKVISKNKSGAKLDIFEGNANNYDFIVTTPDGHNIFSKFKSSHKQ